MSQLAVSLEAQLRSWRRADAEGNQARIQETGYAVYKTLFDGDQVADLWDEVVLNPIVRLLESVPPEPSIYGERVERIRERAGLVSPINDFFHHVNRFDHAGAVAALVQLIGPAAEDHSEPLAAALGSPNRTDPFSTIEAVVGVLADTLDDDMATAMRNCLAAIISRGPTGVANALLVRRDLDLGTLIRVTAKAEPGSGQVKTLVASDAVFTAAIHRAKTALQSGGYLGRSSDSLVSFDVTDAEYVGNSISLAAALAIVSSGRGQPLAPYMAFTGDINLNGQKWEIAPVNGIAAKLRAAVEAGCRRAFIPAANADEVDSDLRARMEVVPVADLKEVLEALLPPRPNIPVQDLSDRKSALLRSMANDQGWHLAEPREIQGGRQFTVSPPTGNSVKIDIYTSGAHAPKRSPDQRLQPLFEALRQMDGPSLDLRPVQQVFSLADSGLRARIHECLLALGPSEEKTEQYCEYVYTFRSGPENLVVKQYSSGKLQFQGRAGDLLRDIVEVICAQYNLEYPRAQMRAEDYLGTALESVSPASERGNGGVAPGNDRIAFPHIGTDESGKGDYFGPLVVAAVWVDRGIEALLKALGVRDSKALTDSACLKLAAEIRKVCAGRFEVVEILPDTYNGLYEQFQKEGKSLNDLLAWGHARALESLLERNAAQNAIADQFGNERYIESKLMEKGRRLQLVQTPKAERYVAVAAASILARAQFLNRLGQLQARAGVTLPKGASNTVVEAARSVVTAGGPSSLRSVAKLHFKTTDVVLNKPAGRR